MYDLTDLVIWLGATLSTWVVASEIVTTFIEKVKPTILSIMNVVEQIIKSLLGDEHEFSIKPIRDSLIVVFIYVAAYMAVDATAYNLFDGAPSWLRHVADGYEPYIGAGWLALGAFLFHRVNDALYQKFTS